MAFISITSESNRSRILGFRQKTNPAAYKGSFVPLCLALCSIADKLFSTILLRDSFTDR